MKISVIGIMRGLFHVVKFIFLGVNCLKGLFTQKMRVLFAFMTPLSLSDAAFD